MRHTTTDPRGWTTRPRPIVGRRGLSLLLMVTLFGGVFVSAPPRPVSADDLTDAYNRQTQLEKQIAAQKAMIASLSASQSSLSKKLTSTKATLNSVVSDLNDVKVAIVAMTVDVANAQAGVEELETTVAQLDHQLALVEATERAKQDELDARKAMLADRIRNAYDTDRTSLLETILSGNDFTDVLTDVGYHLDFAEQDKTLAQQIVADQKVLAVMHETTRLTRLQTETVRAAATAEKASLDGQMKDLAAAKARLAALEKQTRELLAAQKAAYAKMAADKKKLSGILYEQLKAQKALEALIEKLVLQALQAGGIPSVYAGKFIWPMPGIITQEFGCTGFWAEPAYGSCAHFHRGIDIANAKYTAIRAAGSGKVVFAGKSPYDTAWIVVIAHSTHLVSWYGHVDNNYKPPVVRAGQYVAKGQIIAYEGMTGNTTGPHLHWAVQIDDTWVNPRLFL